MKNRFTSIMLIIAACSGVACGEVSSESYIGSSDQGFPAPTQGIQNAGAPNYDSAERAMIDRYAEVGTNPFTDPAHDPYSTFAADVDTASYDIFRRDVGEYETLPDPDSVRLEEYVNSFEYEYGAPSHDSETPFVLALEASEHPMGRNHKLFRVGIQAKDRTPFEKKPANIVFLIDTSGSMASADKLPLVQRVLNETLEVLDDDDTISIVTYAGSTGVALEPTPVSNADAITGVINSFTGSGGTAGGAGITLAYEQAEAGFIEGGINHVVLCTDGDFNVGPSSDDALVELIEEKRETGVTLTALGFGRGNLNDSMMERVSNAGNGIYSVIINEQHATRYAQQAILSALELVAKDLKIQVEWNPALVQAYRLLGYENRAIDDNQFRDDTVDAGEVGAGHRVTAIYELILTDDAVEEGLEILTGEPVEGEREVLGGEIVAVKIRYKDVDAGAEDEAHEIRASIKPDQILSAGEASPSLTYASAIAAFAEILKGSPFCSSDDLDTIETIATAQAELDEDRGEFLELFQSARTMLPEGRCEAAPTESPSTPSETPSEG